MESGEARVILKILSGEWLGRGRRRKSFGGGRKLSVILTQKRRTHSLGTAAKLPLSS